MPLVTSANIACGAHAGDEATMRATVALALRHGVAIGAHPGYRDPANFGRVALDVAPDVLRADVRGQIAALVRIAAAAGARVTYVKAHGALYHRGESDDATGALIADAVAAVDPVLAIVVTLGSAMERAATRVGLRVMREGFIDRAYEPDGTLRARSLPGALITDPAAAVAHALELASRDDVDTLCIHGDTPGAPTLARAVRSAFREAGIEVRAPAR